MSQYSITRVGPDCWQCSVVIQDGTERWTKHTREEAIHSVILTARTMNGVYIREDHIEITEKLVTLGSPVEVSAEDAELLKEIKRGALKVLDCRDPRVLYNLTDEECELIVKIREGDVVVT